MSRRATNLRNAGIALALALLAACGDVTGVDIDGGTRPNWPWPWHTNASFSAAKTRVADVPAEGRLRIQLDAVNGEIEIKGQPGTNSVRVAANLRVGSFDSREHAQEGLNELDFLLTAGSDQIFLQTRQPQDPQGRQYVANYTITVPSDMEIDVHQSNGHVTVDDIESSVFVEVGNGNIDGTVRLPSNGEVRLTTGNGALDLRVPTSTSAKLSAFTDLGTITLDNLELLDTVRTNKSLTGNLGDGAGLIDLETMNGGIDVTGFDG